MFLSYFILYFWFTDQSNELLDSERGSKYQRTLLSVWISFFEIYNEYVYELLDLPPTSKTQKRKVLRICEDQGGSSYVKGNSNHLDLITLQALDSRGC